jgi:hypothetical protein
LAVGVRFLIEKRNDERNKRLMQKLPNNERKQEHGKPDRRAAPGSEQDYRKDERPKAKAKSQKPVKACAAYTKGQCKKGQSCLEYHDDKARENRERNLALAAAQRREKREQADKNKERGRKQTPGPNKPSKQKCWAYAEGKCTRQNCRFIHEALNADDKKAKEQWEKDLWDRLGKRPSYKLTDADRKAAAPASSQPNSQNSSRASSRAGSKGSAGGTCGRSGSRDSLRSRGSSQFRPRSSSAGSKGSAKSRGKGDKNRRRQGNGRGKGQGKDKGRDSSSSRK